MHFSQLEGLSWRKDLGSWVKGKVKSLLGEGTVSGAFKEAEKPERRLQAVIVTPK